MGEDLRCDIVCAASSWQVSWQWGSVRLRWRSARNRRVVLDDVLKKDGHVLFTRVGEKGNDIAVGFLVAAPKGEAKVVGILIGLTAPRKE